MSALSFVSWNLCMLVPSQQSPANWRADQSEAIIGEILQRVAPDFIFFQELPGVVPSLETHELLPATVISHCGNVATLAKKSLLAHLQSYTIDRFAVCAQVDALDLTLANVHLEPGRGRQSEARRAAMVRQIVERCATQSLLIIGDTNTRIGEEELLAELGMQGERPPEVTWDTHANRFRDAGPEFSAYFTRYFHNASTVVEHVKVWSKPIVQDQHEFYLSDHFAISGTVSIVPDAAGDESK